MSAEATSPLNSFLNPRSIQSILASEDVDDGMDSSSDDNVATANDVVARREWKPSDPTEGQHGKWMYKVVYSDGHAEWIHRGHPDERLQPRLFDVVDRHLTYVAKQSSGRNLPVLSLGDFKKADLAYNRKIGCRPFMDCVENAIRTAARLLDLQLSCSSDEVATYLRSKSFTNSEGLSASHAKRFVDWLMKRGFKINRDVYNTSLLRNRRVDQDKFSQVCQVLQESGPGVYIVYTSDVSLMGHYWTVHVFAGIAIVESEAPRCFISDMREYVHLVHFVRKCEKR